MSTLSEIAPTESLRLIDLVEKSGVDISDWGNLKGGKKKAASNPKYCFEWSFIEPKKVVVLNLWHSLMEEIDGIIQTKITIREYASKCSSPEKQRALRADDAIQTAIKDNLPIRVIILDGKRRKLNDSYLFSSRVSKRFLDPISWSVTTYDWQNGACVLTRGTSRFVDQFSTKEEPTQPPGRRTVTGEVFNRSKEVRGKVLSRANGICEWCGKPGFITLEDKIYLETHHVIPLCENGADRVSNVVALCPNDHREAHHGKNKVKMRQILLSHFGG